MKTKTFFSILLILIASSIVSLAIAESIPINDKSELLGKWTLNGTSNKKDGQQRPAQQMWEFRKDGTLVSTAEYESAGSPYATKIDEFTVKVTYEVKDGKLVAGVPGRPGKNLTYQLIERKGNKMILRQGSGEFMFFEKQ